MTAGGYDTQIRPATQDGRLWKAACEAAEARATAAESEVSRLTERLAKVEAERDSERAANALWQVNNLTQIDKFDALLREARDDVAAELRRANAAESTASSLAERVKNLETALKSCLFELNIQADLTHRCGDPGSECPLQDIHKPSDSHFEARNAARAAPKESRDE